MPSSTTPVRGTDVSGDLQNPLVSRLKYLFFHRSDVFPVQRPDGTYAPVHRPVTDEDIARHLAGEVVLGAYQLAQDNSVRWACFDIDYHDGGREAAAEQVRRLGSLLSGHRVLSRAYAVEHTGGMGFHVWLFFDPPIPALAARRLAEELARRADVECEIFPKQVALPSGGLGSLVKCPLGRHLKTGNWSVLLTPPSLLDIQPAQIPPDVLEELGRAPEPEAIPRAAAGEPVNLAGCLAFARICEGVGEGCRDEAAFFLARFMYAMGMPSDMALAALTAWDKKNRPPLGGRTLEDKVRSAYRKGYRVGSLSLKRHELLGRYCEGCRSAVCKRNARPRLRKRMPPPEVIL